MVGAASWDVAFHAYVHATREVWVFILLGIFYSWMVVCFFLCFLLDCRLHTFLFYWIAVYIDLYVKRGTSIVRGAAVLVLSVEDKAPKLASTVSS